VEEGQPFATTANLRDAERSGLLRCSRGEEEDYDNMGKELRSLFWSAVVGRGIE